jgi:hypothetical protein
MLLLIIGVVVFAITIAAFIYCLPRDGKMHRFVGTELEPYVAVLFTAGAALGFTAVLSGILDLIG